MNKKKTILITGAGQGIGQAIAFRFASDGFNVVVVTKDSPPQVQETLDEISAAGGQGLASDTDVRNAEETSGECFIDEVLYQIS